MKINNATITWICLILLSMVGAYIGEFSDMDRSVLAVTLIILVVKAQLIVDYFMELKQVKIFWRSTMSAFAIFISVIIWFIL